MKIYKTVADFYDGKCVFITGGTGFLGKVILEKLLYSCPGIDKIYVLIRDHKGLSAEQRIQKLLDNPVFKRLREKRPDDLNKIVAVTGDIVAPNLGIGSSDVQLLIDQVSVVIHAAATVRFDEPLKVAYNINVGSTKNVLELCNQMKNIKAFVHVSTAYCNALSGQAAVEEKLYPPPMNLEEAYELAKGLNGEITEESLCGRPNTYTFTKALAETVVKELCGKIPTAIVRPSIVTPAMSEPTEGWIDNWFGATAILMAIGKGYCKYVKGSQYNIANIIPVDYVSNAIVVAAASFRPTDRCGDIKVLNLCSSSNNPLTMGELWHYFTEQCVMHKFNDLPYPRAWGTTCEWFGWLLALILEVIPAHLADLWRLATGKPKKYIKLQAQMEAVRNALGYFTSHSWVMQTDSLSALAAELTPEDARVFPCNPRDINWKDYIATYFYGVKKYLVDKAKK